MRVLYGPPIDTKGLSGREIVAKLQETFERMFAEVKLWSAELEAK